MSIRSLRPLLPVALLAGSNVFAACTTPSYLLPLHYRVGADTQHCQYDDIQSAIDAVGECPTIIDITREHLYTHQHLGIADKPNLTLQGWGDGVTCSMIRGPLDFPPYAPPDSTAPLLTISGSADGGGSVLYVTGGTHLAVRNLTISGGLTCADCSGGGIYFSGVGSLDITRSTISFNESGYGAGVNFIGGNGPQSTLTLDSDTLILSNTAGISGGGIRIEQNYARLDASAPSTIIAFNKAPNGYGGGIELVGAAEARIGSPGYGNLGVVYGNQAQYGGGVAVVSNSDGIAEADIFSTDATHPVTIQGNTASHSGGGIYLQPQADTLGSNHWVLVDLWDYRITDNIAAEGAAIYADVDSASPQCAESHVWLNTDAPPAGSVRCVPSSDCNSIDGNVNEDPNANPTDGSTVLVQGITTGAGLNSCSGELQANRLILRGNRGAHAIRGIGAHLDLANTLIADNILGSDVVRLDDDADGGHVHVDHATIAGNAMSAGHVLSSAAGPLELFDSIVAQPGIASADPAITDGSHAAHVLSNDRSTLPDTAYMHEGAPTFVDAAHGDYHLAPTSLGVDDAPAAGGGDLERKPRAVDLPDVPNQFGPMDLGAFEIQPSCSNADTVFCDGFDRD